MALKIRGSALCGSSNLPPAVAVSVYVRLVTNSTWQQTRPCTARWLSANDGQRRRYTSGWNLTHPVSVWTSQRCCGSSNSWGRRAVQPVSHITIRELSDGWVSFPGRLVPEFSCVGPILISRSLIWSQFQKVGLHTASTAVCRPPCCSCMRTILRLSYVHSMQQ